MWILPTTTRDMPTHIYKYAARSDAWHRSTPTTLLPCVRVCVRKAVGVDVFVFACVCVSMFVCKYVTQLLLLCYPACVERKSERESMCVCPSVNMCMYTCVRIYVYVYKYMCFCASHVHELHAVACETSEPLRLWCPVRVRVCGRLWVWVCLCVCVCVCVCMCVCVCRCAYEYVTQVNFYESTVLCAWEGECVCVCARLWVWVFLCVCVHVYVCVWIRKHLCVCMHIYICKYICVRVFVLQVHALSHSAARGSKTMSVKIYIYTHMYTSV